MAPLSVNHEANQVQIVLKAIDVLECLAGAGRLLSAPEVGRRCRFSRPTAYRFLVTLSQRGKEERTLLLDQISFIFHTANTTVDRATPVKHLNLVRERGFVINDMLGVSGPAHQISLSRLLKLAPLVRKAAETVSGKSGYVPPVGA